MRSRGGGRWAPDFWLDFWLILFFDRIFGRKPGPLFPEVDQNLKLIKIYLIPPNKNELKERLIKRNQDSQEEVERRFKAYDKDIQHWKDYDYIIINKNLENCYKQIENIILINKKRPSIFFQTIP